MKFVKTAVLALAVTFVAGCDGGSEVNGKANGLPAGCTLDGLKTWAYDRLLDDYLFYDQVPVVNPLSYESAASLVENLRVSEYDRFSRVVDTFVDQEIFEEGKTFGLGAWLDWDDSNQLRAKQVYDDSPLGRAGISRGDILVSINDVPVLELTSALYDEFVGTRERPARSKWSFRDGVSGQVKTVMAAPAVHSINTVLHAETIELPEYSESIAYLVLDSFLGTTEAELDQAIAGFREDNIGELILDLRYNGGGLISTAVKLGSQIGGAVTDGQLATEFRWNDKYSQYDEPINFAPVSGSLNLDRLIVLTTDYTASASELIINSLTPYIDVVTIGSRTTGKPYGSLGQDYCGKTLHAMQVEGFNANNVSVYGGIAPSCGSADDFRFDFGSANEPMLNDALDYLVDGRCEGALISTAPRPQNDAVSSPLVPQRPVVASGARMK